MLNQNVSDKRNACFLIVFIKRKNRGCVILPQFAIVSVDMLKEMQGNTRSAQGLLALAKWAEKEHVKGPKDLSENHDNYIWDK